MMAWVEGFLEKHKQQPGFNHGRQAIPPYPGLSVPKKAWGEGTQRKGKEMHILGRCNSALLASALSNPDSAQYHNCKSALKSVTALVNFALMAQSRSHTPDILSYMERYLETFHLSKDILLEFRTSKAKCAEANRPDRELMELVANQHANEAHQNHTPKRHRQVDPGKLERANQQADLIRRKNHFNFIKMHYLSHFGSHVRRFGSICMYSTEIDELV